MDLRARSRRNPSSGQGPERGRFAGEDSSLMLLRNPELKVIFRASWTAKDVADQSTSTAKNRAALASLSVTIRTPGNDCELAADSWPRKRGSWCLSASSCSPQMHRHSRWNREAPWAISSLSEGNTWRDQFRFKAIFPPILAHFSGIRRIRKFRGISFLV